MNVLDFKSYSNFLFIQLTNIINHGQQSYTYFPLWFTRYNFNINFKFNFTNILVVQTSFTRTLATGQAKGPMDYVKQGVDQLGQAAEKVKEAVSSATSTVVGAVTGDSNASKLTLFNSRYFNKRNDSFLFRSKS